MSAAYTLTPDTADPLENQLRLSLRRVQPDRAFVDHLQTRLTHPPAMVIERRQNAAVGLLFVAISLASGVIVVWLMHQMRGTPSSN